jgi:hypothetical protein
MTSATVAEGGTPELQVRSLASADHAEWRALLARSEQGSVYALPEYLDSLSRATGGNSRLVGAWLYGRLVAGLPIYELPGRFGPVATNRTLLYYNGLVLDLPPRKSHADQTSQMQAVLAAIERFVAGLGHALVLIHNDASVQDLRPFLARGWQPGLSYTYVVPLDDLAAQWDRVDQNLRRLVRRCEREGVTYREDTNFDDLFRLHLQTHQRKGAPLYLPEPAFRGHVERVQALGLARLGHAVFEGKVIASQLMLTGPGRTAHIVCAGADDDYLRMGASAFLRWRSFESLAAAGYRAVDLTDAALNPVTRFKSQLGGRLTATISLSRFGSMAYRLRSAWHDLAREWRTRRGRRDTVAAE